MKNVIFIYDGGSMTANAECRRKFRGLIIHEMNHRNINLRDFSKMQSFYPWFHAEWQSFISLPFLICYSPAPPSRKGEIKNDGLPSLKSYKYLNA